MMRIQVSGLGGWDLWGWAEGSKEKKTVQEVTGHTLAGHT